MEFYGRQDILSILDKRAHGLSKGYRQNIAIIGDEFIGKSCLIRYWLSKYHDNFVIPVYIEVKPEKINVFLEKFIGTLLFAFLKNSQIDLRDNIDFLIGKAQSYAPRTCTSIKELLSPKERKNKQESFLKLLELTELLYGETGKHCIIIFDEFHLLAELNVKDIFPNWRKQIMLHKNTMYILLSSRKQLANKLLASDLDLLFGNFEKIELKVFDNKTAQGLVQDKFKTLNIALEIKDFIVNFSFCHPFYLTVICNAVIEYQTKNPALCLTIASFTTSLESIFSEGWGILNSRFSYMMKEIEERCKDTRVRKILLSLASGITRAGEIAHYAGSSKKEVSLLLTQLYGYDVVSKNADLYVLNDRIFGFWLRCIYANRLSAFSIDNDRLKQLFKKEIEALYAHFCDAQSKEISERILELFNQFGNESVEVHKKRMRLNHFKEVKLLNINGKNIKEGILARAANCLWIAGLKEDRVVEEDIIEFVDVCKRFKYNKSQKRIFITFNDMDANASLIAKEEKIATWDIAFINSLLDIYDKPRIVR